LKLGWELSWPKEPAPKTIKATKASGSAKLDFSTVKEAPGARVVCEVPRIVPDWPEDRVPATLGDIYLLYYSAMVRKVGCDNIDKLIRLYIGKLQMKVAVPRLKGYLASDGTVLHTVDDWLDLLEALVKSPSQLQAAIHLEVDERQGRPASCPQIEFPLQLVEVGVRRGVDDRRQHEALVWRERQRPAPLLVGRLWLDGAVVAPHTRPPASHAASRHLGVRLAPRLGQVVAQSAELVQDDVADASVVGALFAHDGQAARDAGKPCTSFGEDSVALPSCRVDDASKVRFSR
jgi:hypothetical protein